ncbi:unnamed protein product [Natator depressus]
MPAAPHEAPPSAQLLAPHLHSARTSVFPAAELHTQGTSLKSKDFVLQQRQLSAAGTSHSPAPGRLQNLAQSQHERDVWTAWLGAKRDVYDSRVKAPAGTGLRCQALHRQGRAGLTQ